MGALDLPNSWARLKTQARGFGQAAHDIEVLDRRPARAFAEIVEPGDEASVPAALVAEDGQLHCVAGWLLFAQQNFGRGRGGVDCDDF